MASRTDAGAARSRRRPGSLLWSLLLLLLPLPLLSAKAAATRQPGAPGLPRASDTTRGSQGTENGGELAAGGPQGSVGGAQGPFEAWGAEPAPEDTRNVRSGPSQTGSPRDDISRVCGKHKMAGKLYGGQDAAAARWPWQASLLYHSVHLCGAVLIDSRWLLSAAHCFLNKSKALGDYKILLGNTQLYQQTQHTQKMSVSRILMHPDFEKLHSFGSDIAMLQLHLPVNFTSSIVPVCLPAPDVQLSSLTSCWITGWGMLTEEKRLSPPFNLQESEVGLLENRLCNLLYGQRTDSDKYYIHEEMVCVGNSSTAKSICRGDSGGPLVCHLPNTWVLVGLASWGLDCRHPVYPSVFTRVSYFVDWINGIKRLTSSPDPASTPSYTYSSLPVRAAGSPGPYTALRAAQTWLLLSFILRASQKALM
uniref:Peptidase S1 domain-containing protein n=1 Tax=Oryctolagus cuniculus TaxID=9986 RepID=A0A5F9CUT9_RABIT|nr:putative serine protease 47 [Oryctolagus cuniculus]